MDVVCWEAWNTILDNETPKTSGRHRGAPTKIGDKDAPQAQRPEVHTSWMPTLQAP